MKRLFGNLGLFAVITLVITNFETIFTTDYLQYFLKMFVIVTLIGCAIYWTHENILNKAFDKHRKLFKNSWIRLVFYLLNNSSIYIAYAIIYMFMTRQKLNIYLMMDMLPGFIVINVFTAMIFLYYKIKYSMRVTELRKADLK